MIATSQPSRYIMIGGFLGAGKTTALSRLGHWLSDRGVRVGLITNDQSTGLVDTALLRSQGFSVEEIAGGCFCCRFNSLLDAAENLTARTRPDVFLAEPVGSCTDLAATVSYPLRRMYGDRFSIAPLSVLVDPVRAARIFELEPGRSFSPKVVYVYRKQIEEADYIVINKCDLVTDALRARLREALRNVAPQADIFCCSAREATGLEPWFERMQSAQYDRNGWMEIDYRRYGEGEALLGWLNATVRLTAERSLDANELLITLAGDIRDRLQEHGCEIAHLKITFDGHNTAGALAVVSVVRGDDVVDLRESILDRVAEGSMILNLRAEGDPEVLHDVTMTALTESSRRVGAALTVEHVERFRPGKPTPTHARETAGRGALR